MLFPRIVIGVESADSFVLGLMSQGLTFRSHSGVGGWRLVARSVSVDRDHGWTTNCSLGYESSVCYATMSKQVRSKCRRD